MMQARRIRYFDAGELDCAVAGHGEDGYIGERQSGHDEEGMSLGGIIEVDSRPGGRRDTRARPATFDP